MGILPTQHRIRVGDGGLRPGRGHLADSAHRIRVGDGGLRPGRGHLADASHAEGQGIHAWPYGGRHGGQAAGRSAKQVHRSAARHRRSSAGQKSGGGAVRCCRAGVTRREAGRKGSIYIYK